MLSNTLHICPRWSGLPLTPRHLKRCCKAHLRDHQAHGLNSALPSSCCQTYRGSTPSRGVAVSCSAQCSNTVQDHSAEAQELLDRFESTPLHQLMQQAAALRDAHHPSIITFSPKVFIPLTRLCRDSCGYCTFALPPTPGRRAYMTIDEVLEVAKLGQQQGCTEALFTLGDKPELLYPEAKQELLSMGYNSTLEYVHAAASAVLQQTGLLPHINAGVMGQQELAQLRQVSASQGLMLESVSERLMQPGGAHHDCPDKEPAARLATIAAAGEAQVPFTSGILIGIGETRLERIQALLELRKSHQRHGHIQEVIIQNFRAKQGTAMQQHPEAPLRELLWTVAAARLLLGGEVNIQAPPNLTPEPGQGQEELQRSWRQLLEAGINDWGGISPVTRDFVNPEKPWPHLSALAAATAAAGKCLVPRLPLYPPYLLDLKGRWLDGSKGRHSVAAAARKLADSSGLVRGSGWCPGLVEDAAAKEEQISSSSSSSSSAGGGGKQRSMPAPRLKHHQLWSVAMVDDGTLEGFPSPAASPAMQQLLHDVLHNDGADLSHQQVVQLLSARGADMRLVCEAADELRRRTCGDDVTYVVNRNINYTNVCGYGCKFCAFSKGKASEELRGAPYMVPLDEITRRTAEAWDRGATEVCMQGGIHPDFTGETYLRILAAAKAGAPDVHVHAFSPLEVHHGATSLGLSYEDYLSRLKAAGLGSLPGTAAEVLCDDVRSALCPDKLTTQQWLQVVEAAHRVGLRSTATIMFGHLDAPGHWASHLLLLRNLQRRTRGLSEFVPLPFVHMQAPLYMQGGARRGPTLRECVLMHAVARLVLHPHVTNIQASWVKMGLGMAAQLLQCGCNDMGGVLMNESITRAAGAGHGQEVAPKLMEEVIRQAGRRPVQRGTLYGAPPAGQAGRGLAAVRGLAPLVAVAPAAAAAAGGL